VPGSDANDLHLAQEQVLRQIEEGCSTEELVPTLRSLFARSAQLSNRERFLRELDAETRPLVDPPALMQTTARLLAEHLGVDRCAYANVENETVFDITGDHARGVPSIVGRWQVAAFGPACVADMLANRPYVVDDTDTDPRIPPELLAAYRATTIRAVICVPLHKQGRFTAAMAVHQTQPRPWRPDEIELVAIVVGRCWEALERAGTERRLAEHRFRLDYAVKLSGIGFWYCDLPFDELMWDARTKEHFFLPPETRVTLDLFYERMHPDDREATRAAIDSSIENYTSYDVVYRTVNPATGEQKSIRALGGAAYAVDGTPLRFDGVTVDVTAQKRAEEQLRDQDRRKDEFLATLAHELRNPLAPIRTGLELIQVSDDAAVARRAHQMMDRQLTHLVRMVDDLLDISRVTLGKVRLVEDHVDIQQVITSAIETVRSQVDANGLQLVLDVADLPLVVHGDPTRLAQIVSNLLSNAAKYTPRGGRITVSAARRGTQAEIGVTDTGIGIPPDKLPEVFEMFAQLGQSIDRANAGLGIGLTLARRLVELHGGTIEAHSDGAGRGATFLVRLPLATAIAPRPASEPAPRATGRRILVVDDNIDAAETLGALLELSGHAIRLAHTGHEALVAVAEQRPEIVLLDIGLPGLDGYEVARRIRADQSAEQPLLVALTGWGAAEDRRKARDSGFDEHFVKPVEHAQLAALIVNARR
jgi:signal transduction histidine kinase/CheY-like chemotaxis protein